MTSREPIRAPRLLPVTLILGLLGGCAMVSSKSQEHASSSLLSSGPQPKVTSHQAADMQIALGRTLEDEGKFEEARPAYVAALKKDPKRADAEVRLAILDDYRGEPTNADQHFERALKLEPRNPDILCDRGYSFYLRRNWSSAEGSLREALTIDPRHARSHNNMGLVLARQGQNETAMVEFAKAGCDQSDARANLALVHGLEGRFEESRKQYSLSLLAKPNSAKAQEGMKASSVALTGQRDPSAIAARVKVPPRLDPALARTSATTAQ